MAGRSANGAGPVTGWASDGLEGPAAPYSENAEQAVLAGLLLDNSAWDRAGELLKDSDFYRAEHRLIYAALGSLMNAGKPADVITVFEHLTMLGKAEEAGGLFYLNALAQSVASAANVRRYAEIVRDRSELRKLAAAGERIRSAALASGATLETVRECVSQTLVRFADGGKTQPPPFRLRPACDLTSEPPMVWRVKGLLPRRGIGAVYGPPGSAKSFLAIDLIAAIAEGRTWFGFRVTACRVIYLALEGASGFGQRLSAWENHHQRPLPNGIEFITEPVRLVDDVVKLVATLAELGGDLVIVVDTLNAATPGADENASRDTGLVVEAVKMLADATSGLVLLIAHTGKNEALGLRGHSSQFAALDGAIQTSNEGGRRSWQAAKVKDGEAGGVHAFRLRQVVLGADADGDPITSCVIEPDAVQSHVDGIVSAMDEKRADELCVAGFRALREIGIRTTDGHTSPDYLPTQLIAKGFAAGYSKGELARAMNRLMGRGVFVRAVIGKHPNRMPKFGLMLKETRD